jgi:hypothetical protein
MKLKKKKISLPYYKQQSVIPATHTCLFDVILILWSDEETLRQSDVCNSDIESDALRGTGIG